MKTRVSLRWARCLVTLKKGHSDEPNTALSPNRSNHTKCDGRTLPTDVLDQISLDATVCSGRRQTRCTAICGTGRNRTTSNSNNGAGLSQRSTDDEMDGLAVPTSHNQDRGTDFFNEVIPPALNLGFCIFFILFLRNLAADTRRSTAA